MGRREKSKKKVAKPVEETIMEELQKLEKKVAKRAEGQRQDDIVEELYTKAQTQLSSYAGTNVKVTQFLSRVTSYYAATFFGKCQYDQALKLFQSAVKLCPTVAEYWFDVGRTFHVMDNLEMASVVYRKTIATGPHLKALNNLGAILSEQRMFEQALECYEQALEMDPKSPLIRCSVANVLWRLGRIVDAYEHFHAVTQLDPHYAPAYAGMATMLHKWGGDQVLAESLYKRAIAEDPECTAALDNLGRLCYEQGEYDRAVELFDAASKCHPCHSVFKESAMLCLQMTCDWKEFDDRVKSLKWSVNYQLTRKGWALNHPQFSSIYLDANSRLVVAYFHAQQSVKKAKERFVPSSYSCYKRSVPLRIGYVSADFGESDVGYLMQMIVKLHDRKLVEVFCYSLTDDDGSSVRRSIVLSCDHFVDISKIPDGRAAADRIFADGIHILVNMMGFTSPDVSRNEIFAFWPAPFQVLWGPAYPGVMSGLFISHVITDKVLSQMESAVQLLVPGGTPKAVYMPHSCYVGVHKHRFPHIPRSTVQQSNNSRSVVVMNEVSDVELLTSRMGQLGLNETEDQENLKLMPRKYVTTRQLYGLPDAAIVYCSFGNVLYYDKGTFAFWCTVLQAVPNSVLWLKDFNPDQKINLRLLAKKEFQIDSSRLIFTRFERVEEEIRAAQLADICLDTTRFNDQMAGLNMLWAGVPIVTMPTQSSIPSRIVASQLTAMGCDELIAHGFNDYVVMAVQYGKNAELLADIKAKVRSARLTSPLFDVPLYCEHLEDLYRQIWESRKLGVKTDLVQSSRLDWHP